MLPRCSRPDTEDDYHHLNGLTALEAWPYHSWLSSLKFCGGVTDASTALGALAKHRRAFNEREIPHLIRNWTRERDIELRDLWSCPSVRRREHVHYAWVLINDISSDRKAVVDFYMDAFGVRFFRDSERWLISTGMLELETEPFELVLDAMRLGYWSAARAFWKELVGKQNQAAGLRAG